jgi:hypothetical protein
MSKLQSIRALLSALPLLSLVLFGCSTEVAQPDPNAPFAVTQQQLDAAVMRGSAADSGIVGDPFNVFGTDTATTKHKIRDLFANVLPSAPIAVGSIWVRRAFSHDPLYRGNLINDVVMVKREAGFYPAGLDFEYFNIPYDSTTNYSLHPNGVLPPVADTTHRGTGSKLQTCVNCHVRSESGADRLFSR